MRRSLPRPASCRAHRAATRAGRARSLPGAHRTLGTAPARTRRATQARRSRIEDFLPAAGCGGRTGAGTGARRGTQRVVKSRDVRELFSRLAELDPDPETELEYSTPFELLVAVILSAQATDVGVNKATRRLFPVANTPAAILALGEDGLKRYISSIGLYNAKAA